MKHFRRRVGVAALLDTSALDMVDAEVPALIDRAVDTARAAARLAEADPLTDVHVVLRERAMPRKSIRQALNEALAQEMRHDPTVVVIGEDVASGAATEGQRDADGSVLG